MSEAEGCPEVFTGVLSPRLAGGNIPLTRAEKDDNLNLFLYHRETGKGKTRRPSSQRRNDDK